VEAEKSGSNYTLDVVLPAEQTYAPESFGNGSMAMVAVSEDNNITFRNILGGMKLQLKGTQVVTSITLQGKNNEKLSGAATVTAYPDETKPAITMASDASTSVTLNCGSGVQLNESTATEFILALPPVLFSKGFTVTVTDSDSKTYTVETDKANTVLRSSLLTMPAFKLGENPGSGSTEKAVFLNITSLTLAPSTSYTLSAEVEPMSGDQSVVWSSSAPMVAAVDYDGRVTAMSDGTAVISAVSGGASASCSVAVITSRADAIEYVVDGVSYGKGIAIGDVIWAPVNCGYEPATAESKGFPDGKMYQWGRKYGQGYSELYDESEPEIVEGPLDFANAVREKYANTFFAVSSSPYDWTSPQDKLLWNSGTEECPIKTAYDPCPDGWRVPTYSEIESLLANKSSWTTVEEQNGYYFSGDYTYFHNAPQIFLSSSGLKNSADGCGKERHYSGYYWSSSPSKYYDRFYHLRIYKSGVQQYNSGSSYGHSVRCVQVTD
ncbi:MAG: Ig-like domain-containing protein, partial [Bacteroidales bacterium]|nr:Ig-like domain-containing protein [Bacteroidales bacterium]